MKAAKRKLRIYEVPISYHGRTYEEGKKIGWKDGLKALGVIFRFWLIDDLYAAPYGRGVLNNLTGTPQYLSWVARKLRPHVGDTVLEIGAGIGNISGQLMGKRTLYVAAEKDPLHLHALRNRFLRTPNVMVQRIDPESGCGSGRHRRRFRHVALFECARIPGAAGAVGGISTPCAARWWEPDYSGAQWARPLRQSRSQTGAQVPVYRRRSSPVAGRARLLRREGLPV